MTTLALAPDAVRSDHDLVAGARAGDDAAFAALYRRHYDHVSAVVGSMVRDRGRAEDIVQDTFVSALRRMRETDTELAFRAWVTQIARNASIDHYRRRGRATEMSIDSDAGLPPADERRLEGGPGPEQVAVGHERMTHLRGALDELSDTHRQVIVLREMEGQSYQEIGEAMDLTPAGVESTLFRARRRLEHEFEELDTGARCQATQDLVQAMADGVASRREIGRVYRHTCRCGVCTQHARMLGVDPRQGAGRLARVAGLLPLPAFGPRRRTGLSDWLRSLVAGGSGQSLAPTFAPAAWDQAAPGVAKAVAVIAAAVAVGHGAPVPKTADTGAARAAASGPRTVGASTPATTAKRGASHRSVPRTTVSRSTGGAARTAAPGRAQAPVRSGAATPAPGAGSSRPASAGAATPAKRDATSGVTGALPAAPVAGTPAEPVRRTVDNTVRGVQNTTQQVGNTVQQAAPESVTLPGSPKPVVKPREVVRDTVNTLNGLTGGLTGP